VVARGATGRKLFLSADLLTQMTEMKKKQFFRHFRHFGHFF
jgi:hypothetical protein